MPKISVIVPVYNVENYLHRCVDSILAQSFTDFELILVDDGSPDNCGRICDEYAEKDNRIHVIHKENGGLSDARNAGIDWTFANSDSEWLTFIDSDDWVHPKYLGILLDNAKSTDCKISVCEYQDSMGNECFINKDFTFNILSPEEFYITFPKYYYSACFKLYKKELLTDIRFPYGKLNEDAFVIYKVIFSVERVAYVDAPFYMYCFNPNSIMRSSWTVKRLDELEAIKAQIDFYKRRGFNRAYSKTVESFAIICIQQIKLCEKDNNPQGRKIVKRILRNFICRPQVRKVIPLKNNQWYYETAFPTEMKVYWYWQALKSKLKGKNDL